MSVPAAVRKIASESHSLVTSTLPTWNATFSWTSAATSSGTKKIRRIVKAFGRFIRQPQLYQAPCSRVRGAIVFVHDGRALYSSAGSDEEVQVGSRRAGGVCESQSGCRTGGNAGAGGRERRGQIDVTALTRRPGQAFERYDTLRE